MKNLKAITLQTVFITAAVLAISSCNSTPKTDDNSTAKVSGDKQADTNKDDSAFLVKAAEINLEEIKLGQLAQQNTLVPDIKDLGKMMEADHNKCMNELTTLAQKKSIAIPGTLSTDAQTTYQNMSKLTGPDFDKQYSDMMVNGHKEAIALFEKESTSASDADIRQWATATLTGLHKHLEHAIECQQNCGKL